MNRVNDLAAAARHVNGAVINVKWEPVGPHSSFQTLRDSCAVMFVPMRGIIDIEFKERDGPATVCQIRIIHAFAFILVRFLFET
jgi:nicotinamidase-related amidase